MDDAVHTFEVNIKGTFTLTHMQMLDFYGVDDPQEAAKIDAAVFSDDVGAALSAMEDSEVVVKVVQP